MVFLWYKENMQIFSYVREISWKTLTLTTSQKIYYDVVSPLTLFEPCTFFSSKSYNLPQT